MAKTTIPQMNKLCVILIYSISIGCLVASPSFTVDAGLPTGKVSPRLYGLMTEEINHSYDGGLYAELIRNRAFLDDAGTPAHWSVVDDGSSATMALDPANRCNDQLTSLRLTVDQANRDHPAGVANSGYWGIPVYPGTRYRVSLLARAAAGFSGPLTLSIISEDGKIVYASEDISGLSPDWKRFEVTLKTHRAPPLPRRVSASLWTGPEPSGSASFRFFRPPGTIAPMACRKDLMQMLDGLNPKFLRFPGGNYLEGNTVEDAL